jgi:hypothetical protein
MKNEISVDFGRKTAMFEHRLHHQRIECPSVPRFAIEAQLVYSLLALLACLARPGQAWPTSISLKSLAFSLKNILLTRAPAT